MRSRVLPAVGVSAAALALATTIAPMAGAQGNRVTPASQRSASSLVKLHPAAGSTCYSQLVNDNGTAIISQNFAKSDDAFDSQGADDFTLKSRCKATTVNVKGSYFNGSGPADSVNVTFYKGKLGQPGRVVSDQYKLGYSDRSGTGNFKIKLEKTVTLKQGTYWVSVQANLDASDFGGEWGWLTNDKVKGTSAMWQNPGGGFNPGCTTYKYLLTCVPANEGGDFAFSIS